MATLKDVAAASGLGLGTVSRALSGHSSVAPATRKRVEEIARRLGYQPNVLARALRKRASKVVGLVIPDLENGFYTSGAARMQEVLAEHGYQLIVCCSDNDPEIENALLTSLLERQVDAIAHVPCSPQGTELVRRLAPTVPVVEYARRSAMEDIDSIVGDEALGSELLVARLIAAGHRNIAMLAGPPQLSTTIARVSGFRAAVSLGGLSASTCPVVYGEYRADAGDALVHDVLASHPDVTALFLSSSSIVLGAIRALRSLAVQVPQDISVVGFLNPPWFDVLETPVTTYELPLKEMGSMVADLLLQRIQEPIGERQPRSVRLGGRIIDRSSIGPPRTAAAPTATATSTSTANT